MTTTKKTKESIGDDLKDFISSEVGNLADNHLESWKKRYGDYKKVSQVRLDIRVNHDPSLEVEYAEEKLGRELNGKEYDYLCDKFGTEVIKRCKKYINCGW